MRENLPQRLARLIMTAGFGSIDMDNKYVAIKMHFGEPGNQAYLQAQLGQSGGRSVKDQGGKPFLTDCNTLYMAGERTLWTISSPHTRMVSIHTTPAAISLLPTG